MRGTVILAATAILAACGSGGPAVVIDSGRGPVRLSVEIVDTDASRQRGMMGRTDLGAESGMLFIWDADVTHPFWMKDTPLPLSIAFIAADGRIARVLDMEPCLADPCPLYDPRVAYRRALEVRRGSFALWGVREGDLVRLLR